MVVKLLACGARGMAFDSRFCCYNFRDWLSPASKSNMVEILLKDLNVLFQFYDFSGRSEIQDGHPGL